MDFVKDIGVNLYVGGFVLVGRGDSVLVLFPESEFVPGYELEKGYTYSACPIDVHKPTHEQFQQIVRQMDLQEVEITTSAGEKMVVRMTQRQLDSTITWKVFQRDNYTCRYCGVTGVPMTYDHILRWEEGGDTTLENGTCACRKCNNQRGNTDYSDWINSDVYKKKSMNLSPEIIQQNLDLVNVYRDFPKRLVNRKR